MTHRLSALTLALAACGGSASTTTTVSPVEPTSPAAADPSCPVAVVGTTVRVEDTDGGAALVFTSTGDLGELRERVATMAAMHDEHHAAMAGKGGADHSMHAGGMVRTHSEARAEDVVGGARIVYTPAATDVAALRDELRMHAEHLGADTCAMDHAAHDSRPTPPEPEPEPAPEPPKPVDLVAAEMQTYEAAKPVFEKYCAGCHVKGSRGAKKSALKHFEMTSYPFTGHHAASISAEIREVLGATGKKPTMPQKDPGAVKGEELALILAWADAFDAVRADKSAAP